jgi:hypothetical protein
MNIKIRDNEKGTYMLIDVANSGDRNVIKKEAEKILKYKDLITEIQFMWNVKVKVIPAILIGAQLEPFLNHSNNICATHQESMKLRDYKKTAILVTTHILWKVLM